MRVTGEAPAKLNLFLHVTGRRPDGYHTLESVFLMVSLDDRITIDNASDGLITRTGDVIGTPEKDLCVRAAMALREATGCAGGARIHVEKHIPAGAGMGGGSSDAAAALILLNRLWGLGLSRNELSKIGLKLGADVPFFIFGETAFARGVGEVLTPVTVPQKHWSVVMPEEPMSTAAVYGDPLLKRDTPPIDQDELYRLLAGNGRELFGRNDLEPPAVRINPAIGEALAFLGPGSRMTGSGSAVFRAAETLEEAEKNIEGLPPGMRGWAVSTLPRHPLSCDKMPRP